MRRGHLFLISPFIAWQKPLMNELTLFINLRFVAPWVVMWSAYHWWDWWPSWAHFHPQLRNPWFRPGQRQAVGSCVWTVWTQALTSTFRCLNKNSKFNLHFLHPTSKIVWPTIGQPQSYDTAESSLWSVVCGVLAWLVARKYDCLWQLLLFF